jgi:hypothetical protein
MWMYSSTHYKPSHLMTMGGQVHPLFDLIPGERYNVVLLTDNHKAG